MKNYWILFFTLFLVKLLLAQSIHEQESQHYNQYNFLKEENFNVVNSNKRSINNKTTSNCSLNYEIYGWNPYWVGTDYKNYDYSLLSTVSYFSYEVNPSTGSYDDIHYWKTTAIVDSAHNHGVRVELCVTNFGSADNATLLGNAAAKQTLIDSLISLIKYRNADGVNIDFESVGASQKTSLTQFMIDLCNQMHSAIPGSTISMAIPSVDWSNVYDVAALNAYVDRFIIMGYGYHYSGSSEAGPVSNLYSGSLWGSYNLVSSVNYYLDKGASKSKLLLGIPYYGYEWKTVSSIVPSSTLASGSARYYNTVKANYAGTYPRQADVNSNTSYYTFQSSGSWYQCWADDEYSLAGIYDMVKQKGIAGIGIWALGYDDGYIELWNVLKDKFSTCATVACSDTLYDMGGPNGDYYDDEDYTFTIAPDSAYSVTLKIISFDLENGYDYLYVYDGNNTSAKLIGTYTGTISQGSVTSSTGALTLQFISDGSTTNSGWELVYSCNKNITTNIVDVNQDPIIQLSVFPNPFSTDAQIKIATSVDQPNASIQLFDYTGRLVSTIHNGKLTMGAHRFLLGNDVIGKGSGVYFIRYSADAISKTCQLVVVE